MSILFRHRFLHRCLNAFFMENGSQNGPADRTFLFRNVFQWSTFGTLWAPFGCILVEFWLPFTCLWLPFGSLLACFGSLLVPLSLDFLIFGGSWCHSSFGPALLAPQYPNCFRTRACTVGGYFRVAASRIRASLACFWQFAFLQNHCTPTRCGLFCCTAFGINFCIDVQLVLFPTLGSTGIIF